MNAGDTFLVDEPGTSYDSHLWMVISDLNADPNFVVIVNFTTWRADKDQACIVDVGDHPYIQHKSCVNYRKAKHVDVLAIRAMLANGDIKSHDPLSPALLQRIRECAIDSRMEMGMYEILEQQGLA